MTIKLEYGKRYVMRDGGIVGPLVVTPTDSRRHPEFPFFAGELPCNDWYWREDGTWSLMHPHENGRDLVAEYVEPIKLEYGKSYVRGDGRVTAPLITCIDTLYRFRDPAYGLTYMEDGRWAASVKPGKEHPNNLVSEYVEPAAEVKPPTNEVRTFESGATRNLDTNKLDYEGFNCPAAQRAFAEYMHTHRKQADGTVRDSDNWQKGIPAAQYMKSIVRHVHDLHSMHRGWVVVRPEDGVGLEPTPENKIELLSAVWFNVQGMIHELLKTEKKS